MPQGVLYHLRQLPRLVEMVSQTLDLFRLHTLTFILVSSLTDRLPIFSLTNCIKCDWISCPYDRYADLQGILAGPHVVRYPGHHQLATFHGPGCCQYARWIGGEFCTVWMFYFKFHTHG